MRPAARPVAAVEARAEPVLAGLAAARDGGPAVLPVPAELSRPARDRLVRQLTAGPARPDTVLVVATSGSTGRPRGVELSWRALRHSVTAGLARLDADPGVPWLGCLPLSHVAGVLVLLRGLSAGTPATVIERFDPAVVRALPPPLHFAVVPTMLHRLLAAGMEFHRHGVVLVGGAAAPPGLLQRARQAGARVVASYGMTETTGGCVYDGQPLDEVDVAVDAGGRIRIAGPVLFTRYRDGGGPRGGWHVTQDLGRLLPDGRLQVRGRADDVIVSGGHNVLPSEVETVLAAHPGIDEVVVVGVPDEEWGRRVVAVATTPPDATAVPELAEVRALVAQRLDPWAAPRMLRIVPTLPRLDNGKVDRRGVRRLAGGDPPQVGYNYRVTSPDADRRAAGT